MRTEPRRIYADTSVFGGCFDQEFAKFSQMFFAQVREGRFRLVVSPVVREELLGAPGGPRDLFQQSLQFMEEVDVTDSVLSLSAAYLKAGILTPKWRADALHVASASVGRCNALVSWNFRHIVHFDKIGLYNAVNALEGYGLVAIHTPAEMVRHEEDV